MSCPSCEENIGKSKFCPECGEKLEVVQVPETTVQTESYNSRYSIQAFLDRTAEKFEGNEVFELENDYLIDVNLDGKVWAKLGSMVAYTGEVKFEKQSSPLMSMKGYGNVFLADNGKRITILNLEGSRLYVNGNDVLAFEESIDWDREWMSGGLFNIRLQGHGMIAITTHYIPITLAVIPERPVYTDPNATVAWSDGLSIDYKTDISLGTLLGSGSGETFQMVFKGDGFVIVQPYEEFDTD